MKQKINYGRVLFLITLPTALSALVWLLCTLPLDNAKLFTRLIGVNITLWGWLFMNSPKILIKKRV